MARICTASTSRIEYTAANIAATTQMSWYSWIKNPIATGTTCKMLACQEDQWRISLNAEKYGGGTPTAGSIYFGRSWNTTDQVTQVQSPGATWTIWNHLAVTYDGSATTNAAKIYLNGILLTNSFTRNAANAGGIDNAAGNPNIGNDNAHTLGSTGTFAYSGFHNVVLTQGEILEAMWSGFAPRGAYILWPLFGVDSPEPDYSGLKRSGTITTSNLAAGPPIQAGMFNLASNLADLAGGGTTYNKALTASVSFSGARKGLTGKKTTGSLTFAGSTKKRAGVPFKASLPMTSHNFGQGNSVASDSFTYTDGTLVGNGDWTQKLGAANTFSVVTNQIKSLAADGQTTNIETITNTYGDGDYQVQIITPVTGVRYVAIHAKMSDNGVSYQNYVAAIFYLDHVDIVKMVSGTSTTIASNLPYTMAANDYIGINVVGTVITPYYIRSGVAYPVYSINATGLPITTGYARLFTVSNVLVLDNFSISAPSFRLFKRTGKKTAGALTFGGLINRHTNKNIISSLTFSGLTKRITTHRITALLTFSGVINRLTARGIAATVSFSGAANKILKRSLTGNINFVGTYNKLVNHKLGAAVNFIGALSTNNIFEKVFAATLNFSGGINRKSQLLISASIGPTGTIKKLVDKKLSGTLLFVGQIKRNIDHRLSGSLDFIGNTKKSAALSFAASMSFVGNIKRITTTGFSAILSSSALIGQKANKYLSATLSSGGSLKRNALKKFAATLIPSGFLNSGGNLSAHFEATISFVGNLNKSTSRKVAGATLTFVGMVRKTTMRKPIETSLSFIGNIIKRPAKNLVASISSNATLRRDVNKSINAELAFSGLFASSRAILRSFAATLTFNGALKKSASRRVVAVLTPVGSLGKRTLKSLLAALVSTAQLRRGITHRIQGVLTLSPALSVRVSKKFPGSLSFSTSYAKMSNKRLIGSLSFGGLLNHVRTYAKNFSATLGFSGELFHSLNFTVVLDVTVALISRLSKPIINLFTAADSTYVKDINRLNDDLEIIVSENNPIDVGSEIRRLNKDLKVE